MAGRPVVLHSPDATILIWFVTRNFRGRSARQVVTAVEGGVLCFFLSLPRAVGIGHLKHVHQALFKSGVRPLACTQREAWRHGLGGFKHKGRGGQQIDAKVEHLGMFSSFSLSHLQLPNLSIRQWISLSLLPSIPYLFIVLIWITLFYTWKYIINCMKCCKQEFVNTLVNKLLFVVRITYACWYLCD